MAEEPYKLGTVAPQVLVQGHLVVWAVPEGIGAVEKQQEMGLQEPGLVSVGQIPMAEVYQGQELEVDSKMA